MPLKHKMNAVKNKKERLDLSLRSNAEVCQMIKKKRWNCNNLTDPQHFPSKSKSHTNTLESFIILVLWADCPTYMSCKHNAAKHKSNAWNFSPLFHFGMRIVPLKHLCKHKHKPKQDKARSHCFRWVSVMANSFYSVFQHQSSALEVRLQQLPSSGILSVSQVETVLWLRCLHVHSGHDTTLILHGHCLCLAMLT